MRRLCRALVAAAVLLAPGAWATCNKVTGASQYDIPSGTYYNLTGTDGVVRNWSDTGGTGKGGPLGLPGVVTAPNSTSVQPIGTVIASGTAPFSQWGNMPGYDPNQILFRCQAADASSMYEMYAIHGNERYTEYFSVPGMTGVYYTNWTNVGIRITNLSSGSYFQLKWNARALNNLDKDSKGYLLVKAKNFTAIQVELIRTDNGSSVASGSQGTDVSGHPQPYSYSGVNTYPSGYALGYVAFSGPGMTAPINGGTSMNDGSPGYGTSWPGMVDLYDYVKLRRQSTCAVTSVTPVVVFPSTTVAALNSGGSNTQNFTLNFNCQTGAITNTTWADTAGSGSCGTWSYNNAAVCTTSSGTTVGFLPSVGAVAAAQRFSSLKVGGSTGLTYLLSDQYPAAGVNNGIARGVGIQILRNSSAINLLSVDNTAGNASKVTDTTANNAGWYKLVDVATTSLGGNNYSETFQAKLVKLPAATGETVTPGKVYATAQVLIRVQ
nr:fimbrial protein [Dyella soli]